MTARLCADHRNADAAAAAVVVVAAAVVDDVIVAAPRHARVSHVRARDAAFRARRGCGHGLNGRYKQQPAHHVIRMRAPTGKARLLQ